MRGKVKYTDHSRGYGYIVPDEADDPRESIYFDVDDVATRFEELAPGTTVDFHQMVRPDGTVHAQHVQRSF